MAESKKPKSEMQQLKERIAALETQLAEEKAKQKPQSDEKPEREVFERMMDESEKITQGLVASGLETLAVAADMTRNLADRASQMSSGQNGESVTKRLTKMPLDMGDAALDALGDSVDGAQRVIGKFREKYKEN